MPLAETTRKLEVGFYAYLHDRVTKTYAIPPLADLVVKQATQAQDLGRSWFVASSSPPTF